MRRFFVYFMYLIAGGALIPGVFLVMLAFAHGNSTYLIPAAIFLSFGFAVRFVCKFIKNW